MIWVAILALGNMGVSMWLIRENRKLTLMAIAKNSTEVASMLRADSVKPKKKKEEKDAYHTWRNPSEGVAP